MALTKWNDGPAGADFNTRVLVVKDCDGLITPKQSYRVMGDQVKVDSSVQLDPFSDDRFQRILRVHLSAPPVHQRTGLNGCIRYDVYEDDLASVWGVNLFNIAPAPATPGGAPALAAPTVQFRFIQSIVGNQTLRATVRYKPVSASGNPQGLIQLHGVESTDLEVWAWIDPEENGTVSAIMSLMVTAKMAPSSSNDVILGLDATAIP